MIRWYAYQTARGLEQDAADFVRRQGFEVLALQMLVAKIRRGAVLNEPTQLFPGYGLVSFDRTDGAWRNLNTRDGGGIRIVTTGGENPFPIPLLDVEVDRLAKKVRGDGFFYEKDSDDPEKPWLALEGKEVEIVDGRMRGYRGIATLDENERLRVLMTWFKRPKEVEVDWKNLRLVG